MEFYTQYKTKGRINSALGSREKPTYHAEVDRNGVLDLVEDGKINIYDEIQSHRDSVDIQVLLKRYQNGETDVLEKVQGQYGDFTRLPKTYAEMLNLVIKGEQDFYSLPVEIRAKFNHSYTEWLATAGEVEWFEKLGYEKVANVNDVSKVEEVKEAPAE